MRKNLTITIPYKFPSLNAYTLACRGNRYSGAKMKKDVQKGISPYLNKLPKLKPPIHIDFFWEEKDKRRDPDNVAFAKKFVLDAMVILGKIPNDTQKYISGFSDSFAIGPDYKVTLTITEVED